jgi:hypothetical protein
MPSADFVALASAWCCDQSAALLCLVWSAYDALTNSKPVINAKDVERSITQVLEPRIRQAMSGDEPFYIQHGPYERETMKAPPAQPPQYDLAFILYGEERIMWPLEAKVLESDGAVSEYVKDIRQEFLTCRYAPFSSGGAMLAYLLSGSPAVVFNNISQKCSCKLESHPKFPSRPHKRSCHNRNVPQGKKYPVSFQCHHLILEFHGIKRISNEST